MSKTATLDRLKSLRLYGMVAAWTDLIAQGESSIASSKWLIDHLDTQDITHTPKDNPSIVNPRKVAQIAEALDWLLRNLPG